MKPNKHPSLLGMFASLILMCTSLTPSFAGDQKLTRAEKIDYLWTAHSKIFEITSDCKGMVTDDHGGQWYYYSPSCVWSKLDVIKKLLNEVNLRDPRLVGFTDELAGPNCPRYDGLLDGRCLDQVMEKSSQTLQTVIHRLERR